MALNVGERLGPYEILAPIGAGGMGEVYRARDPRLKRDVAIKVSQERFSDRFEREARAVAALNHPNICTLHDVGPNYLVMEFIEGESPKGPLPLEEGLRIAGQIADALEAAHDKGVVHRDLKPANIKIKPDGTVKVLDFGLAKTAEPTTSGDPQSSPTLTISATRAGAILGTAAYMAPEQARGRPVDKRADIWAFGVVLYELLTGRMLFQGEDLTEVLASVVKDKPDLSAVPPQVHRLLSKCLEKDPNKRLRDIGDMALLLEEAPVTPAAKIESPRRAWMPWAVAGALALALAALAAIHFRQTPPESAAVRFQVPPPEGGSIARMMALSPDGRRLVFSGSAKGGVPQLFVRALDLLEARPLPETEGGIFPFWSPDGRFVAFTSPDRKLKKIDASGGPAQTLCSMDQSVGIPLGIPVGVPYAGFWTRDGFIFFGRPSGIFRVPQAGGEPVLVSPTDTAQGELFRAYPQILPDGRHFLYLNGFKAAENSAIYVGSFDGKVKKRLAAASRGFRYAPPAENDKPGHLLFLREETLMAQPLHPQSWELAGDAFPVAERIAITGPTYSAFTVSENGALAYQPASDVGDARQLTWFDRAGKPLGTLGAPAAYENVALARDGMRAAVSQYDQSRNLNLWLIDVARGIPTRFTFEKTYDLDPVWSPDGSRIVFTSNRDGSYRLYAKNTGSAAKEEQLHKADTVERPCNCSPDGRVLMYTRFDPTTRAYNLWFLSGWAGDPADRKPAPYLETQFQTTQCQFSPDGRWVAYASNEAQHANEIYVQSFPAGADKYRVSSEGGSQPRWRRDGKELFYMAPAGKLMAIDVKTAAKFQAGIPRPLFDSHMWLPAEGMVNVINFLTFRYDVTPDGQRFLVNTAAQAEPASSPGITVILNWTAGLKK
jgi:Tol biopolymer transport system component